MHNNTNQYTQDYLETLWYARSLANLDKSQFIFADHIFLWAYKFTCKHKCKFIMWRYLWIADIIIIKDYFDSLYGTNIELRINDNNKQFEIEHSLVDKLNDLTLKGLSSFDFLSLLYSASYWLSKDLITYMIWNWVNIEKLKQNTHKLLFDINISKIWIINIFNVLNKAIWVLEFDPKELNMFIEVEGLLTNKWNNINMTSKPDLSDNWMNNKDDTKIDSKIKQDEKKLTIEYFSTDLTKEAKWWFLDPVIGREKEVNQLIYTLLRKTKNNPLLIWEAWVWKTAIVEWFSQRIINWEVPDKLKNKRVYMLDMWSLLAGTKYRGEFEARLKSILDEASDRTNNIILFIDELHTIIWAWNAEWSADAANMLKPLLSRWKIQMIWATTYDEYQKHIEKDPALKRRFQEIKVDEPNRESAIEIMMWLKQKFEDFHGVNITQESIITCIDLSNRYILNKQLPDKAIDLLDEACARSSTITEKLNNNENYIKQKKSLEDIQTKLEKAITDQDYFKAAEYKDQEDTLKKQMNSMRDQNILPKHLRPIVDINEITNVIADKLWVPANQINKSEIEKLKNLDQDLKSEILWQDEWVDNIVKAIKRTRLSMVKRNKPIASFLFLWPSGVWKTFIGKLLAQKYYWDEKSLVKVDMSEYTEKYSMSKLIWSAPWYVGYEEWWLLTEAIRRKPYSIVLFDEIEKASPDVLNILLQIMDEWQLKDSKWRLVDFKNTIIILTSNIWSQEFAKKISKIWFDTVDEKSQEQENFEKVKERVLEELKNYLSPEFINRFDNIVVFKPLSKEILARIFKIKLNEYLSYWKWKEGIKLPEFTMKKIDWIIEKIYKPEFWARPIERYIQDEIEPELIEQLLAN